MRLAEQTSRSVRARLSVPCEPPHDIKAQPPTNQNTQLSSPRFSGHPVRETGSRSHLSGKPGQAHTEPVTIAPSPDLKGVVLRGLCFGAHRLTAGVHRRTSGPPGSAVPDDVRPVGAADDGPAVGAHLPSNGRFRRAGEGWQPSELPVQGEQAAPRQRERFVGGRRPVG